MRPFTSWDQRLPESRFPAGPVLSTINLGQTFTLTFHMSTASQPEHQLVPVLSESVMYPVEYGTAMWCELGRRVSGKLVLLLRLRNFSLALPFWWRNNPPGVCSRRSLEFHRRIKACNISLPYHHQVAVSQTALNIAYWCFAHVSISTRCSRKYLVNYKITCLSLPMTP